MLSIERKSNEELHLIDEQGRRIEIRITTTNTQRAKLAISAPATIAIVRTEMGPEFEAAAIKRARSGNSSEPIKPGDAA